MIAYRDVVSDELVAMLKNESWARCYSGNGKSTFTYNEGEFYKHFFIFGDHADSYKLVKDAVAIEVCSIPREIINQVGFGYYGHIKSHINNKLYNELIPIPEILIKDDDFIPSKNVLCFKDSFNSKDDNVFSISSNPFEHKFEVANAKLTYADIYYELVYELALKHDMNFEKVIEELDGMDFHKELEEYFHNNYKQFQQKVKDQKQKLLSI